MQRPLTEIPQEAVLPFSFGTQLKNLLFPQEFQRERARDNKRERFAGGLREICGDTREKQGVTDLVKFNQLFANLRIEKGILIFKIIDRASEKRIVGEQVHDAVRMATHGENVHAAVVIAFRDFQNFRAATDVGDAVGKGKEHAERCFFVQTLANHATVTRFENVQGK